MESNFEPPKEGEKVIDSANGKERARWLLTKYLQSQLQTLEKLEVDIA